MHLHRISVLPATLLTLLLPSPSFMVVGALSSERSICVRENALLLAEAAACGNRNMLRDCFLNAPHFVTLKDLERCFVDADCTIAEAAMEAMTVARNCDASGPSPELRRRGPNAMPDPTPAPQDAKSTSPATTQPAFSTPTECSTEKLHPTTVCPVSSLGPDNFTKLPCTSTTVTDLVCAATNVCLEDGSCVFRDDHLTASGLVATIALAAALAFAVGTILVLYVRDKRDIRKKRLEAERAKIEAESRLLARKRDAENRDEYDSANPFAGGH